jgi:hypothetical protein
MLGILTLLPLMKGWDYKFGRWTRTINRGQTLEIERIEENGWLLYVALATDNCYGGFSLSGQGADLSTITIANAYPKAVYDVGGFLEDPAGWMQLYYQPNPQSSRGVYYLTAANPGFHGSVLPYVPTTILNMFLLPQSTENEARVSVGAVRIVITDKKQFIKSLRAIIGMPIIQDIDSALLVAGVQEVTQKGEFDKEKERK